MLVYHETPFVNESETKLICLLRVPAKIANGEGYAVDHIKLQGFLRRRSISSETFGVSTCDGNNLSELNATKG